MLRKRPNHFTSWTPYPPNQGTHPYNLYYFNPMEGIHGNFSPNQAEWGNWSSMEASGNPKSAMSQHELWQNPLQPDDHYMYDMFTNQYGIPKGPTMYNPVKLPKSNSLLNSFKTQDGNYDINKMVNTAGQLVNALTQVSSMVKGVGTFFKL